MYVMEGVDGALEKTKEMGMNKLNQSMGDAEETEE
jgi:hypothetical protein